MIMYARASQLYILLQILHSVTQCDKDMYHFPKCCLMEESRLVSHIMIIHIENQGHFFLSCVKCTFFPLEVYYIFYSLLCKHTQNTTVQKVRNAKAGDLIWCQERSTALHVTILLKIQGSYIIIKTTNFY